MNLKVNGEDFEVDRQDTRLIVELAIKWFLAGRYSRYNKVLEIEREMVDLLADVTGRPRLAKPEKIGLPED